MDTLKPLAEVTEPDFRNQLLVSINKRTGEQRQNTLRDMHGAVSDLELAPNVPEDIRTQFAVGQNLAVYAWFCYRFHMTAELQALATLEFALRERLQPTNDGERKFKTMLRRAVRIGLLHDGGFRYFAIPLTRGPRTVPTKAGLKTVHSYAEVLVELLPQTRNNLAHGARTLFDGGAGMVRLVADLINQLFTEKSSV